MKNDLNNINKIIKDNVDKAVKSRDKQISEMNSKLKDSHDKIKELE